MAEKRDEGPSCLGILFVVIVFGWVSLFLLSYLGNQTHAASACPGSGVSREKFNLLWFWPPRSTYTVTCLNGSRWRVNLDKHNTQTRLRP